VATGVLDGLSHPNGHLYPSDLMGDAGQKSLDSRPNKIHTQINLIYDANLQPLICRAPHIHDTVMVSSKQMTSFYNI
ncbi:MAG: hypothetical protein DRQ99_13975, partial [Candidatus Parabeggiatoa sp. nov. 3]